MTKDLTAEIYGSLHYGYFHGLRDLAHVTVQTQKGKPVFPKTWP